VTHLTVEECLELLVGLKEASNYKFEVYKDDSTILTSIARQVYRGVALTDRQFDLLVKKFESYTDQFNNNSIDIKTILEEKYLRMPFRDIDRKQEVYIETKDNIKLIVAKFPFNKKLISKLQTLREKSDGQVTKAKNKWKFILSEHNVKIVGDTLSNFDFSDEFKSLYDEIISFVPHDHVPGIYYSNGSFELKNVHPEAVKTAQRLCGDIKDNTLKYLDRAKQFGITYSEFIPQDETLAEKIASRTHSKVLINDVYSIEDIFKSLIVLDRFPLLVTVDEEEYHNVQEIYNVASKYISNSQISVMFRLSNDDEENVLFNTWIKENSLNNWVDDNTKIVFIESNKIPKPVMNSYKPQCVLTMSNRSRSYGYHASWTDKIDLQISYRVKPLYETYGIN
jgi:hypothetical protein